MTGNRPTNIPIFDLKRQNKKLMDELTLKIKDVISSGRFILGDAVKDFEQRMADQFGGRAVGVGSGTAALYLALKAIGISEGDEVITTPFTFIAPVEIIMALGARPVFVDIDPETFNINPDLIEAKITPRTKAILPVHLFGLAADMPKITRVAEEHDLFIIEDCAQAFGARIGNGLCGTFGEIGCFSFFPTKILSCFGDGGMVVTRDDELADRIRSLRVHGARKKYFHEEIGINSRLDEIQAAILLIKLQYIDQWIKRRHEIAAIYNERLKNLPIRLPAEPKGYFHVYHQYTIRTKKRNRLQSFLRDNGIGAIVYYPAPLHIQPVCKTLNHRKGDFPEAELACQEVVSLPMFPELTSQEIESVVSVLSSFDW